MMQFMRGVAVTVTMVGASMPLVACAGEPLPRVGDRAPPFSAVDETGARVSLGALKGVPVVLYSYPMDDTPGCTREAKAFSASRDRLQALGVVVLGISGQDAESHRAFKQKHGINFPLLVDPDRAILKAYGMWNGAMARRSTVVIDPDGRVAAVWPEVKVDGHDAEVLATVESMMAARKKSPSSR